jgi:glycosyltransferase involved in cell wall biosynthesis
MERMAISRLIRESLPDLVNAHWAYAYALGAIASGCPTLVTVHDWAPAILRYSPTPYWLARQLMYFRAVRGAERITTVSPYVRDRLERIGRRPVTVIPNGIESSLFGSEPRSLNAESPTIISVNSGFNTRKNVTSLLAAFPLVRQAVPSCELVLVGPEFQIGGPAQVWAERHDLAARVDFHGLVSRADLCALLDRADVLVHPAREEAFGMTLIEAMARRTPVVGGCASGAVPWVLCHGRAGVLVDVRSSFKLAGSIVALLGDPTLWSYFSESGYRLTRERFSMDRVVGQYLEAYGQLLDRTN